MYHPDANWTIPTLDKVKDGWELNKGKLFPFVTVREKLSFGRGDFQGKLSPGLGEEVVW